MPDTIINSTSFSHFTASFLRFVSSNLSSDEDMFFVANDSRNCESSVYTRASALRHTLRTYHLQFVLPELLLFCLIQKWELPDMIDEDVSKDG
jgi:hypothetical protein